MKIYSFFLYIKNEHDAKQFEFMIEHGHCIREKYNGYHPVIRNLDGSFLILYAMTTSKIKRDMFMMTRDMKYRFQFYKSDIDVNNYNYMKSVLPELFITDKKLLDKNKDVTKEKRVFLTKYEYNKLHDEATYISKINEIFHFNETSSIMEYEIFTRHIYKLFDKIKVSSAVELSRYTMGVNDCDIEFYEGDFFSHINSFMSGCKICTFEVFIDLFGNTLKGDEK